MSTIKSYEIAKNFYLNILRYEHLNDKSVRVPKSARYVCSYVRGEVYKNKVINGVVESFGDMPSCSEPDSRFAIYYITSRASKSNIVTDYDIDKIQIPLRVILYEMIRSNAIEPALKVSYKVDSYIHRWITNLTNEDDTKNLLEFIHRGIKRTDYRNWKTAVSSVLEIIDVLDSDKSIEYKFDDSRFKYVPLDSHDIQLDGAPINKDLPTSSTSIVYNNDRLTVGIRAKFDTYISLSPRYFRNADNKIKGTHPVTYYRTFELTHNNRLYTNKLIVCNPSSSTLTKLGELIRKSGLSNTYVIDLTYAPLHNIEKLSGISADDVASLEWELRSIRSKKLVLNRIIDNLTITTVSGNEDIETYKSRYYIDITRDNQYNPPIKKYNSKSSDSIKFDIKFVDFSDPQITKVIQKVNDNKNVTPREFEVANAYREFRALTLDEAYTINNTLTKSYNKFKKYLVTYKLGLLATMKSSIPTKVTMYKNIGGTEVTVISNIDSRG